MANKIFSKAFLYTLFIGQNKWHKHSVLGHTLKVIYGCIKYKHYNLIPAAILHDIGKPFVAHQDEKDLKQDFVSYSFTDHEEKSYCIIKNWKISERTKLLVRYHYLLRGIQKLREKGFIEMSAQRQELYDSLPVKLKNDLRVFQQMDDYGK